MNLPSKKFLNQVAKFIEAGNDPLNYYSFGIAKVKDSKPLYLYHIMVYGGAKYILHSEEAVLRFIETVKTKPNLLDNQ